MLHNSFTYCVFVAIAPAFRETLFVHLLDLDAEFTRAFKPDLVLFVQTERFFPLVIRNDTDLAKRLTEISLEKGTQDVTSEHLRRLTAGK